MRIMLHSVPPIYTTGYGCQVALLLPLLRSMGHEVCLSSCVFCMQHTWQDIAVFGPGPRGVHDDLITEHYNRQKPDVILSLMDTFRFKKEVWEKLPWLGWQVVDSSPAEPNLVFADFGKNLAMSRFGQKMLKEQDIEADYVPLMVDPVFTPMDKDKARAKLGKMMHEDISDRFLAIAVGANIQKPGRKNYGAMFAGWRQFITQSKRKPLLLVHSDQLGLGGGENLIKIQDSLHIPEETIAYSPQWEYNQGMLDGNFLRVLYSAADVLVHTARSEGFGVPIAEAQACECPVIFPYNSSMPELVHRGIAMPCTPWMSSSGAFQWVVHPENVTAALLRAEDGNFSDFVTEEKDYSPEHVYEKYLKPVLEKWEKRHK